MRRVTHRVSARRSRLLDPLKEYRKGFGCRGDLLRCTGQPDDPCVEQGHILGKCSRRIPLRINRYENRLNHCCLIAQALHHGRDFGQCCRTDVGAIGEAKEDQHPAPCEIFVRLDHAAMIGQFEISKKRWFTLGAGKIGTVVGP